MYKEVVPDLGKLRTKMGVGTFNCSTGRTGLFLFLCFLSGGGAAAVPVAAGAIGSAVVLLVVFPSSMPFAHDGEVSADLLMDISWTEPANEAPSFHVKFSA